jgi:predicted phosphoribosyltransferase
MMPSAHDFHELKARRVPAARGTWIADIARMDANAAVPEVPFGNRVEAGETLARLLRPYAARSDVTVLGLPRGGVPVAAVVAGALGAPLDVFTVRKLGVPGYRELAMGAIASGGARVLNRPLIAELGLTDRAIGAVIAEEERELARRERLFRGDRAPLGVAGRTVILVDDGLATGSTMRAAVHAVRGLGPSRVIVAVPVGSAEACRDLEADADEVVCAIVPRSFVAVGRWYRDFSETPDAEVTRLLQPAGATAG